MRMCLIECGKPLGRPFFGKSGVRIHMNIYYDSGKACGKSRDEPGVSQGVSRTPAKGNEWHVPAYAM